jgi:hypothetical protein
MSDIRCPTCGALWVTRNAGLDGTLTLANVIMLTSHADTCTWDLDVREDRVRDEREWS